MHTVNSYVFIHVKDRVWYNMISVIVRMLSQLNCSQWKDESAAVISYNVYKVSFTN